MAESTFNVTARPREYPAHFLGDLVRGHGQRRGRAERNRGQHGRGNQRAVDEGVKGVADDDQGRGAAGVHLAVMSGVAMSPEHQLLEQEEGEDAGEKRAEGGGRRERSQRLGQQREQRDTEQRAHRVADQPRDQTHPQRVAEKEKNRSRRETADAAENAEPYCRRHNLHAA